MDVRGASHRTGTERRAPLTAALGCVGPIPPTPPAQAPRRRESPQRPAPASANERWRSSPRSGSGFSGSSTGPVGPVEAGKHCCHSPLRGRSVHRTTDQTFPRTCCACARTITSCSTAATVSIRDDMTLIGLNGRLRVVAGHIIDSDYLAPLPRSSAIIDCSRRGPCSIPAPYRPGCWPAPSSSSP